MNFVKTGALYLPKRRELFIPPVHRIAPAFLGSFNKPVSGGGGGGVTLIFNTAIGGTSGGCTTSPANTSGSNLFVGGTGGYRIPVPTISDNKVNSWTGDGTGGGSGGAAAKLWYVGSPTTDAAQTFSANGGDVGTTAYSAVGVIGVSGATTQDGSDVGTTGTAATMQPGSKTPSQSGELFVTVLAFDTTSTWSIDSGFTIVYQGMNGNGNGFAIAYKIKTDATAENPTWTRVTGAGLPGLSCRMAAFK